MSTRPPLGRDAIVAAARTLLVEEGLAAVSLRRLAGALGVTAPALYAHVDSKADLLATLAADEFAALADAIEGATVGIDDPIERITAQCHAYVDHVRAHPELTELMTVFRPDWVAQPEAPELAMASRSFEVGAVAVQDAIDQGRLGRTDPLLVSLTLWAAVHGVASVLASRPNLGEEFEQALVDSVIDAVIAGLRA